GLADGLGAGGELEVLCALGGYAGEHPQHPFPTIVEGSPQLDGRALGHPLLLASRCVPNDVWLGREAPHVLVVSGSNMSGKSTLLRTVGLAAVLAQAGAPGPPPAPALTPLALGGPVRLPGLPPARTARFSSQGTPREQLVVLAPGAPALLFLVGELFQGTNPHDRRIGSEAVVRGLLERGAIGLVTTHDLAIAAVADDLAGRAANVHFEDQLTDGTMTFDYRLRPGVVTKSNALELMRAVGLEV